MAHHAQIEASPRSSLPLALTALGIVYGDIGTSPLYAFRECFLGDGRLAVNALNILGVLSLVFWSLMLVVSLKYLVFVMRADNDGEGGILALMTLALPRRKSTRSRTRQSLGSREVNDTSKVLATSAMGKLPWLALLGLFGGGLLYGDGIITPAISVLSAVEGMYLLTPGVDRFVIPITLVILLGLFLIQRQGTTRVGKLFGPVMLVWFGVIAALGIAAIVQSPSVLAAVNPYHAAAFFARDGRTAFTILGVVFLVVTGGEALYADMGHFGKGPIRVAWFALVLPCLLLNYYGQGALLMVDASAAHDPFYLLAPRWAMVPLVVLATLATVIASQAVISGAFSLTSQAIHLGYLPRMQVVHTSTEERGQIYIPVVNWLLFVAVIALVVTFRTSSNLASAYGMAVTTTMVITTILFGIVASQRWQWRWTTVIPLVALFLAIDLAFFVSNLPKIPDGGWFPLVVGVGICILMATWRNGQRLVAQGVARRTVTFEDFLAEVDANKPVRANTPAIYLMPHQHGVPLSLLYNLRHNQVLHQPIGLLTIVTEAQPWIALQHRVEVHELGHDIHRIVAHYGYMQRPNVPNVIELCRQQGIDFAGSAPTYFLGRITLDVTHRAGMLHWQKLLYSLLSRSSDDVSAYFRIPPEQVVEIGVRLSL